MIIGEFYKFNVFNFITSSTYQLLRYKNIELRVHHHSQSKSNQQNHHLNVIKFYQKINL
jgi:hypothetical protein